MTTRPAATSRAAALAALAAATLALAACQRAVPPPPAASPPAASAEPRPYEVSLLPPAEAAPGRPATARVIVASTGSYHVNKDYPLAFRPEPGSTAAFGAEKIPLGAQAERTPCAAHPQEDCRVAAPLPFTLTAPGPATLSGTLAFSVCNADRCLIEKVPLTMAVAAR